MSIAIYTSSERATENTDATLPPCCGLAPLVWTWKRKGFVAIVCQSPACDNSKGVLGYGPKDARQRWDTFRKAGAL